MATVTMTITTEDGQTRTFRVTAEHEMTSTELANDIVQGTAVIHMVEGPDEQPMHRRSWPFEG